MVDTISNQSRIAPASSVPTRPCRFVAAQITASHRELIERLQRLPPNEFGPRLVADAQDLETRAEILRCHLLAMKDYVSEYLGDTVGLRARPGINATPNAEKACAAVHNQRSIDSVIYGRALSWSVHVDRKWIEDCFRVLKPPGEPLRRQSADEQIWTQGLLQSLIKAGHVGNDKRQLWEATVMLRNLWHASFGRPPSASGINTFSPSQAGHRHARRRRKGRPLRQDLRSALGQHVRKDMNRLSRARVLCCIPAPTGTHASVGSARLAPNKLRCNGETKGRRDRGGLFASSRHRVSVVPNDGGHERDLMRSAASIAAARLAEAFCSAARSDQ
jgi:hypothetical protein